MPELFNILEYTVLSLNWEMASSHRRLYIIREVHYDWHNLSIPAWKVLLNFAFDSEDRTPPVEGRTPFMGSDMALHSVSRQASYIEAGRLTTTVTFIEMMIMLIFIESCWSPPQKGPQNQILP